MSIGTSGKNSSLLLLVAFVAAILFAIYYYLIIPKLDEVEAKNYTVEQLTQEIASMEGQLAQMDAEQGAVSNSLAMRKKVPETSAIERVILDITEIEEVTGTRIESVNFNYDVDVIQSTVTAPNLIEKAEGEVNGEQEETAETVPVTTIVKETLPPNLKVVTFSLDVAALDFNALDDFLKEIEKLERVMKTDTISFTLPGEQDQLEKDTDPTVNATVQITTFYYEGEK